MEQLAMIEDLKNAIHDVADAIREVARAIEKATESERGPYDG